MTEKYRWGRAVIALAGITAALAALVVVTNRVTRRPPVRAAAPGSTDVAIRVYPLGEVLTLTGRPGFRVRLRAERGSAAGPLSYTVHVRNDGTGVVDGSLRTGVWLAFDDGTLVGPSSVGPSASADLRPGAGTDRTLVFPAPEHGHPTQLSVTLHLGADFPTAGWDLLLSRPVRSSGG